MFHTTYKCNSNWSGLYKIKEHSQIGHKMRLNIIFCKASRVLQVGLPYCSYNGPLSRSYIFLMGQSRPLFIFYFLLFNTVDNKCSIIFADDWIRTADLWNLKRPLNQLSHNHCLFLAIISGQINICAKTCLSQ